MISSLLSSFISLLYLHQYNLTPALLIVLIIIVIIIHQYHLFPSLLLVFYNFRHHYSSLTFIIVNCSHCYCYLHPQISFISIIVDCSYQLLSSSIKSYLSQSVLTAHIITVIIIHKYHLFYHC